VNLPSFDRLYASMAQRSSAYDGLAYTAVKTTGIYCRPICPAQTPRRENVEFFPSPAEAARAGYRACLRCHPDDMGQSPSPWAQGLMAEIRRRAPERIRDRDLRQMGLEPAAVRREFLRRTGLSFHAWQRAHRIGAAMALIRRGADAIEASMQAGYESQSGFEEAVRKAMGVGLREAARSEVAWCRWIETPLGPMLAAAVGPGLAMLEFVDRRALETQIQTLRRRWSCTLLPGPHSALDLAEAELEAFWESGRLPGRVPLEIRGTPFQESVWRALLGIPAGEVRSYAQQASAIGRPDAARATAKANGDNRLAIMIPCHRVIDSQGGLCGYGGGLWRKARLLELEGYRTALSQAM
jgi:AraC family transcriptional regulator of adaptative response/methylated-DNA-[protein]-cysteine methyltransferase